MTKAILSWAKTIVVLGSLWAGVSPAASAQAKILGCDPEQTTANFTLGDVLHTVHGAFKVKRCELHFDPSSGKLDGEIVFDATSGKSGNDSRDRKMHKEVLESARYRRSRFGLIASWAAWLPPESPRCKFTACLPSTEQSTRLRCRSR